MSTQNPPAPDLSPTQPFAEKTRAPAFLLPIFKLPLFLYRLRLGWLLGHLFMQLTHVGRRSGKLRRTILAVLSFDGQTNEIKAVSAWNASEWYKNIQASPARLVEMGLTRFVPTQRDLSPKMFMPICCYRSSKANPNTTSQSDHKI
jgi:deazaflavin-dependent oxidoreductase (nitroreductase family)